MLLALGAAAGCAPSLSNIERGQAVVTKQSEYDAFFEAVLSLRKDADRAEAERKESRADLARALGIEANADAALTCEAATKKAKKLSELGTTLHLEIVPEAHLAVMKRGRGADADPAALVEAVEKSVKAQVTFTRRMAELLAAAHKLDEQRKDLAAQPTGQKGDVARELDGARNVIAHASDKAMMQAGLASSLVVGLALALETSGDAPRRPAVRPGGGGGGRPGGGAPPPAGPAPKPKPNEDFDP
jgi:hypothetical protein